MLRILSVSRTRSHECSERLEPDIGELICPVRRGLRHEVVSVFVMQKSNRHNSVFYHWYATRTCDQRKLMVRSFWDNGCPTFIGDP
jgi:hypothetical protein